MIVHDVEQNSDTWEKLRCGIPTASEFKKIVTPTGKLSKQADAYIDRLLAEWYYGGPLQDPESTFRTQWMDRGHDLEEQAVRSYEFETGNETEKVGFVTTDDGLVGCSPDRLIGEQGILEIKCPKPENHMGYMRNRAVDADYWPQIQGQLSITGREWVDIVSYSDIFPPVTIRVERDEEYIGNLESALRDFVRKLLGARKQIIDQFGEPAWMQEPAPPAEPEDGLNISDEDVAAIFAASRQPKEQPSADW
jgi:hypothetical protein